MIWLKQIGRWLMVMLLQVLLVNQLQLWGVCHPFIYILPLLLMPNTLPGWANMFIGAAAGLVMDVFCNSLGVHMAACILLMFLRPYLIRLWVNDTERLTGEIDRQTIGVIPFVKYVLVLVSVHHAVVFCLTAWTFRLWWFTLLTILVSALLSILLILVYAFAIRK